MTKRVFKSTINRNNIEKSILYALQQSDKPLSTQEIAFKLGKSWHTVIRYCLDLAVQNKIYKFDIGRINAWQVKK